MAYTPSGTIAFYRVPWKSDYKDVRLFTSKTEESNYFSSPLRVEQNYTYIRDKQAIKVNANKEAMEQYNYIRYMNENFSLKWFYAFITGVEYINQNACYVYFTQDVYTTWWDCFNIKSAFVEREHTNNDSDAYNTETEDISISKYEQDYIGYSYDYTPTAAASGSVGFIAVTSDVPYNIYKLETRTIDGALKTFATFERKTSDFYSAVFNGITMNATYVYLKSVSDLNVFLSEMNSSGSIDSVSALFAVNKDFIESVCTVTKASDIGVNFGRSDFIDGETIKRYIYYAPNIITGMADIHKSDSFSCITVAGYEPKNRKIFHYPFCKWVIDANNGDSVELRPELLHTAVEVIIDEKYALDVELKIRAIPRHYAITDSFAATAGYAFFNVDNSVSLNGSISVPFTKDNAAVWSALNRNVTATQLKTAKIKLIADNAFGIMDVASGFSAMGANLALVNPSSITGAIGAARQGTSEVTDMGRAVMRDAMQLAEIKANIRDKSNLPSQLMNMTYDDTWAAQNGMMKFTARHMCPPLSEVKKYDNYLSKYGYATNMFKTPNLTGRANWNYVKTTEITIAPVAQNSYAPTDTELRFIEDIFNKGVTFWHINDVGNYGDYTNEIVGGTNGK